MMSQGYSTDNTMYLYRIIENIFFGTNIVEVLIIFYLYVVILIGKKMIDIRIIFQYFSSDYIIESKFFLLSDVSEYCQKGANQVLSVTKFNLSMCLNQYVCIITNNTNMELNNDVAFTTGSVEMSKLFTKVID